MNDQLLENLLHMFIDQLMHAVATAEDTLEEQGVEACRKELQAEYDRRNQRVTGRLLENDKYEFIDALVLPSILFAGLYLDLVIADIEIVEVGDHRFEIRERKRTQ